MDSTFDTGLGSSGRKATIFAIIVALHVLLVWGLVTSLGIIQVDRPPPPIIAEILEEIVEEDEPPPPPPAIETPPPYVPPPDIVVDVPVDAPATTALTNVTNVKPPPAPPPQAKAVVKKAPEIDPKFKRRFQPEYPPTSRRLGEEGSVVLQVLVGPDGMVKDGKIQKSSGFPRLDEAALKHALRAWRFTPGTEDGAPVTVWHSVKVTFKIEG
ncbi:MAG: energy transducer TonB [Gammaproteobacteria bacterium]|nr:energy transducer TonB [Gammaproteobacteria bacterium]